MGVAVTLLGARIDGVDMHEAVERVTLFVEGDGKTLSGPGEASSGDPGTVRAGTHGMVVTLNPELLFKAQFERELLDIVNRAQLVTADGAGIVWACRVAGQPVPERVTGIDLMIKLVERAAKRGWRLFLLGAEPGVAEEAAERLKRRYPGLQIAGTYHGYFKPGEDEKVINIIRDARADLLFAAMGAPKQEIWVDRYLERLGVKMAVGVGGSFDVIAGRARRAPVWMQRLHLEWLGRFLMEPWRWRRMLVLPKFAWLVLKTYKFSG